MSFNVTNLLADLNKKFNGRARAIESTDGSISFIIKGQPALHPNGAKAGKLEGASETTCVVVVTATDKRATLPLSNLQVGGFSKRAMDAITVDSLEFRDLATRTTYVVIDRKKITKNNKVSYEIPTKEAEILPLLKADNGNELADRAFVTVESFNPLLVMSPGQVARVNILKQDIVNPALTVEQRVKAKSDLEAILLSVQKRAYPRERDKNGKTVKNSKGQLVPIYVPRRVVKVIDGKPVEQIVNAPVYTGNILIGGLQDTSSTGVTFDSFYVYRATETVDADGKVVIRYEKGGLSEEARLINDLVSGVNEGEMSIPSTEPSVEATKVDVTQTV